MFRLTSVCLVAGVIGLGFPNSGRVSAAPKLNVKNAAHTTNVHLIQQLETIRTVLNKADHDYKGHRAAAVHQITHAIHLLGHGKQHPNPGQHFVAGTHKEPQNVSDAQLKQALVALQGLKVPAGKHQAQVQAAIASAVADLQAALKVA